MLKEWGVGSDAADSQATPRARSVFAPVPLDAPTPLSWVHLGGLFCLEFGVGSLGALALIPPAPVGPPFYRLIAAHASIPLALGLWLLHTAGKADTAVTLLVLAELLALQCFAIPTKGRGRWIALGTAIAAGGLAVAWNLLASLAAPFGLRLLALLSAFGSGFAVGSIGVAMAFGHAYLTYPNLKIHHFVRVNRATEGVLVAKGALVVATLAAFASSFEPLQSVLTTPGGWFGLFTRFAVGLAMPLLFAFMAGSALRYENTRSATGILYASTVLVLIGEAVAMSLRGQAGGVPL